MNEVDIVSELLKEEEEAELIIEKAKQQASEIIKRAKEEAQRILKEAETSNIIDKYCNEEKAKLSEKLRLLEKSLNEEITRTRKLAEKNLDKVIEFVIRLILYGDT